MNRAAITFLAVFFGMGGVFPTPSESAEAIPETHRIYYTSGALKGEFTVQGGKLNGPTRWYYENGVLGALMHYRDNQLQGRSAVYYPDGSLKRAMNHRGDHEILEIYREGRLATAWHYEGGGVAFCRGPEALPADTGGGQARVDFAHEKH